MSIIQILNTFVYLNSFSSGINSSSNILRHARFIFLWVFKLASLLDVWLYILRNPLLLIIAFILGIDLHLAYIAD